MIAGDVNTPAHQKVGKLVLRNLHRSTSTRKALLCPLKHSLETIDLKDLVTVLQE